MRVDSPSILNRPRLLLFGAAALLGSQLVVSAALAFVALRSRPTLVIPGVRESQVVLPEEIPDAAVKTFSLLYLRYFDDYTPPTIEERSNYALRFVSPERLEAATHSLSERASYVARAKESSHLVLPLPSACAVERIGAGLFRFTAVAERRILIASELKDASRVRYTIELRTGLPTEEDPYGLLVVAQSIRLESPKEAVDERR
jgi:hypothetical protein